MLINCLMLKLPKLLVIVVCLHAPFFAWSGEPDSLRALMNNATRPAEKVPLLVQLADYYRTGHPDSLRWYAGAALRLKDDATSPDDVIKAYNLLGIYHFQTSSYDSAIFYFEQGLPVISAANDSSQLASFLNNIGLCYTYKSQYDQAIDYHLQALAIREAAADPKLSSSYNNLGITYDRMNDLVNAEKYQLKALELKRMEGQRQSLANTLNNLGIIKRKQEQYNEAIAYYEESLGIAVEFNDRKKMANAYNNIGSAYVSLKDFRKAGEYFEQSIKLKREIDDLQGLARSLGELAEIRAFFGEMARARSLMLEAEAIAAKIGSKEIEHLTYANRSDIEEIAGNYRAALDYSRKANAAWSDMVSEEKNEKIAELEVAYETAKKEAEIRRLSLENQIKVAETAQARAWLFGVSATTLVIIVSLVTFFTMRGKRKEAELALQEHQLDALQKRYADLLQGPANFELSVNLEQLNKKLLSPLSEREFEAFELSLAGATNQEIADKLYLSQNTVKFHLRNVYSKLGVRNRKEAAEYVVTST